MFYIYDNKDWPKFKWDDERIIPLLSRTRLLQGKIIGRMESIGFDLRKEASLETITLDVVKTSEIEGEHLILNQVRSSVARRLNVHIQDSVASSRKTDGAVEMVLDAIQNSSGTLTVGRLNHWHELLFPEGYSGQYKILTGKFRDDSTGPMQVVSGALSKEKVHFQAPPAKILADEMRSFLYWFNKDNAELILKSAVAHLWFVTLHPYEDGNGRIARAISDMLLTRSDGSPDRFYSMSNQIRKERKSYYDILEKTQKGSMDITDWMIWFLECLEKSLLSTEVILTDIIKKHLFWNNHAKEVFNPRQILMINKLFDGITGKLNTSKWAKMTKTSQDTALRDIKELVMKGILIKEPGGGRSTSYILAK